MTIQQTAVHVRRTIAAPPERVYRAWLDPQLIARWFAPSTYTVRKAEVDERVGARLSIWHADGTHLDLVHDRLDGLRDRYAHRRACRARLGVRARRAPRGRLVR